MNNARDKNRLKEFGENFRSIRRSKNKSQVDLAHDANAETAQILRIETGIINPTVTILLTLAEAPGVSASTLFEPFDESSRSKKRK